MVWYGMVNVDLYSAIVTKVSSALNTLVPREKPGFQALSKGLIVLCKFKLSPSTQNCGLKSDLKSKWVIVTQL